MPREQTPFEQKIRGYFSFNKVYYFLVVCMISFLLLLTKKEVIIDQIAAFQFMEMNDLAVFNLIMGLQYFAIPLVYLWKFTVIGFVLWVGCFMWGYRVTYTKCWQVAMIAETLFFVPDILKILWFMFVSNDPDYWEVQAFYPFSLMNLFDHELLDKRYWYALKSINLFEVIYWVVLTYGIDLAAGKKRSVANAIVFTSYVPLFLFWLWFYVIVY